MKPAALTAALSIAVLVFLGGRPEARAADGEPPVFTRQPLPTAVPFGHTAVLAADTAFEPTLRWEWRKNGTVIPGANASRLTLYNVSEEDTAEYHAVALSDAGGRWSSPAAVIVQTPETAPGRIDETFADPGFDGPVNTLAERLDGSVVAGGEFFSARGLTNATRLARLQPGGLPDPAFRPSAGFTGPDAAVLVLAAAGNAVYAGGAFKNFDSAPASGLVRLTPSGARDPAFVPELPAGVSDVRVLLPLSDGRLYAGGRSLQGSTASDWLVRLNANGSRDHTFTSPVFLNGRLRAAAVRPDGKLWLAGNFFRPAGSATTWNRVALIEPNGTISPIFQPPAGAGSGANLEVRCLQLLPDGSAVIGGVFSKVNNLARFGLARILENGSVDPAFDPPVPDDAVQALALDAKNRLYAGGDFSQFGSTPVRSILRFSTSTGLPDPDWKPPMGNGPVQALRVTGAGLVTGGSFSLPRLACARLALEPRQPPPFSTPVSLPLTEPARLFRRSQILATWTGPATVPDNGSATFPVSIPATGLIAECRVWLDLRHPDVQTLTVTLEPPASSAAAGSAFTLTDGSQLRHGSDFRRTLFSSQSLRPLSQSAPPCTDALRPAADLTLLNGLPAIGTWILRVADNRPDSQSAMLQSWTLEIFVSPSTPAYPSWLAARAASTAAFASFAFSEPYAQPPSVTFRANPFRLTHHAWPDDPAAAFVYQFSTDLLHWQPVTPASWQKWITPAEVTIQATFPNPPPNTPRAWWRVQSTRPPG